MFEKISQNYTQKLLALCFALIIWALAPELHQKDRSEVQFFVPLSYVNLPKNLEIISEPTGSVTLFINAPKGKVPNIGQFQVVVDLQDAQVGEHGFEILREHLEMPNDVEFLKTAPDSIALTFEKAIEKELSIQPVFVGDLADGFAVQKVSFAPATVRVRGPESLLNRIDRLETRSINVDQLDTDVELKATVLFPEHITALEPKPKLYTVRIEIGSEPINLRIDRIPIGLVNQVYHTKINPKKFNVLLRGPRNLLEDFTKNDVQAYIDLGGYKPGTYKENSPVIRIRPEIQVKKTWPPINVWVLKQKIKE